MRNLSPWTALASVVFAAAATTAWAAYDPAQPQSSEGSLTPKMQGSDNGVTSDSATPTTPAAPGNAMTPDRSTPDEHHDGADLNSGASPSPLDIGPRVPQESLRHDWHDSGTMGSPDNSGGTNDQGSSAMPGSNAEDKGTTDSRQARPDNPGSPFSPVNPAAPALQDPQGGDPTNPITPANMRYMILA